VQLSASQKKKKQTHATRNMHATPNAIAANWIGKRVRQARTENFGICKSAHFSQGLLPASALFQQSVTEVRRSIKWAKEGRMTLGS